MGEVASTYAKGMIEMLLNVHALACMYRASGHEEHRRAAAEWLSQLEDQLRSLRRELQTTPDEQRASMEQGS